MKSMSKSMIAITGFLGSSRVTGSGKQGSSWQNAVNTHTLKKVKKHNECAPAKTTEALSWCGKIAFLVRKMCSYLVVPCGESLKTYGRINFGFGHMFKCFLTCKLHISLVLVDISELLVTSCCFTEADFICVDFGAGTDRGNYVAAGKKRDDHHQIVNGRNQNIYHLSSLIFF